ncbi:CIC11C00000005576 [Sungouiella intermedia]|uniref:CIC11C00000005576 n=1 Tax=Sungouiella intermedia TaxID=45354 RepID=A0A1L0GFZ8_9ASCO|nr:CIC11C00000005576 [[Candida] intermedia]
MNWGLKSSGSANSDLCGRFKKNSEYGTKKKKRADGKLDFFSRIVSSLRFPANIRLTTFALNPRLYGESFTLNATTFLVSEWATLI